MTYSKEVEKLCKAIDISIDSFRTYPPKDWTPEILDMLISNLEQGKLNRIKAHLGSELLNH